MQKRILVFRFILQNVLTPTCSEVLVASLLGMIKNTNEDFSAIGHIAPDYKRCEAQCVYQRITSVA